MDYGDVVFHVFQEEARRFYALERLWGDAAERDGPVRGELLTTRPDESRRPRRSIPWRRRRSLGRSVPDAQPRAGARDRRARARASICPSTILILGESGTGKDRLARALHDVSVARRRPVRPHRRREPLRRALRERALRPRARRLHGRRRREAGPARGRRGRHRLPRRGVVALAGGAGEVPARAAGEELPAARGRHDAPVPGAPRSSPRGAISRSSSSRAPSATTSSTASTSSPSACRGWPTGARTSFRSRATFLKRAARAYDRPARRFTPEAENDPRCATRGPATSASCCTSSSKAVLAADAAEIGPEDLPTGSLGAPESLLAAAGREPLDAEGAHRRVHRRDAAPGGRQSDARGQAAGRLAQVPLGAGEEVRR